MSWEDGDVLFGRPVPNEFRPLFELVRKMAGSEEEKARAIGLNLIHDHRISEARARHFTNLMKSAGAGTNELMQALDRYRREWIARLPDATFQHDDNSPNCVFDLAPETGLRSDLELVHVCNITQKLLKITDPAVRRSFPSLGLGGRYPESEAVVNDRLRTNLQGPERQASFVAAFLAFSEMASANNPWHPIWAASWDEFDRVANRSRPETWLEAVGLPCPPVPNWLMVLRYRVSDAKRVYRPTQLEAGAFPWHFPSPETKLPPVRGGHPMNLTNGGAAVQASGSLPSEFVHAEIRFAPEYWAAAGFLLRPTTAPTSGFLMGHRRMHHLSLCEEYGPEVIRRWMPDATKLLDD